METPEHYTLILIISSLLTAGMLYFILTAYHKKGVLTTSNLIHTIVAGLLGFGFAKFIYVPLIAAAKYALSLNTLTGYGHFLLMLLPVVVPILVMEIASHNALSQDLESVDQDAQADTPRESSTKPASRISQIYTKIFFLTSTITIVLSL